MSHLLTNDVRQQVADYRWAKGQIIIYDHKRKKGYVIHRNE